MTLEEVVAAALRWPEVTSALRGALTSDLVVANPFLRRVAEFASAFKDRHGSLPRDGDLEAWIEELPERDRSGVRKVLRRLQAKDLSKFTPGFVAEHAGEVLREAAARTAIGRLQGIDDGKAEALDKMNEKVRSIRPDASGPSGPFEEDLSISGSRLYAYAEEHLGDGLDYHCYPFTVRERTTLLSAPPKVGKSTFMAVYAHATAIGGEFLGQQMEKGRFVMACPDEHYEDLLNRHLALGTPGEMFRIVDPSARPSVKDVADVARSIGAKLVLVDTLLKFSGIEDENSNSEWGRWFSKAEPHIRSSGAVWLLSHHDRKAGGKHGAAIRGASVIFGSVDVAVSLSKYDEDGPPEGRMLTTEGTRYDQLEPLAIQLVDDKYEAVGDAKVVQALRDPSLKPVLRALYHRPQTVAQIAERVSRAEGKDVQASELYDPLRKLVSAGVAVEKGDRGRGGEPLQYKCAPDLSDDPPEVGGDDD